MKTSVAPLESPKKSSLEALSFSDAPIRREEDDRLNRLPFAKQIASLIDFPQLDQQVIGLYGEWGEGKTSVLNMALNEYRSMQRRIGQEAPIIVHFCPWEYSAQTNITKALFSTIAKAIYSRTHMSKEMRAMLAKGFLTISRIVSSSLSCAYPVVSPGIIATQNNIERQVEDILKEPTLEKTKKGLDKNLRSLSRRIIVVIDDIDRLLHPEIRELIRTVKANGDLPNLTWILLCDRAVVAKAIAKDLDTDEDLFGYRFLDKIIPMGFDLPKLTSAALFGEFQKLLGSIPQSIPDQFQKQLDNDPMESVRLFCVNMRNVKRLANSILISLRLFKVYQGADNCPSIHFGDFINLEAWRLFEPRFYNAVFINKELLLTAGQKRDEILFEKTFTYFMPDEQKEKAIDFIKRRFGWILCPSARESTIRQYIRNRDTSRIRYRLAHSKYFDLYFSYRLDANAISRSEEFRILHSISNVKKMTETFLDFDKSGKLPSLLHELENPPYFETAQEQLNYLESLWGVAEQINSNDEFLKTSSTVFSCQTRISRCSLYFIQKTFKKPKLRFEAFQRIMTNNKNIVSQPLRLVLWDLSHYEHDEPYHPLLGREQVETIKNMCLERLSKMHENGILSTHKNSFDLRKHWYQVVGGEEFLKATASDFSRHPDAYANLIPFSVLREKGGDQFHVILLDELEKGCDIPKLICFLKSNPNPQPEFGEMVQCLEFAFNAKQEKQRYDDESQIRMLRELRDRQRNEL